MPPSRLARVVAKQRAVDRGTERGRRLIAGLGADIRLGRRSLGLSLTVVAHEVGISPSELSRIERGEAPWVSILVLARLCSVVGLELAARAYPGGAPLRDSRHAALLARFRARLPPALGWRTEVPLPLAGDHRAWDGMVTGVGWRYGAEAEMNPIDGQLVIRRTMIKARDGGVDGVLLLVPDTRQSRVFRRQFAALITDQFPVRGSVALRRLEAGEDPGGNALIVV